MKKLVLLALGFFMALAANASFPVPNAFQTDGPVVRADGSNGSDPSVKYPSAAAACGAVLAYFKKTNTSAEIASITNTNCSPYPGPMLGIRILYTNGGASDYNYGLYDQGAGSCPANSTGTSSCSCSAGYTESGSSCVPKVNACAPKVGVPGVTNFTVGYSRTPEEADYNIVGTPNKVPASGELCDSGCSVKFGEASAVWQSQTPTDQGLYRWSIDFVTTPTGAECTVAAGDGAVDKAAPNAVCPGYVGDINGKKGCYGTANNPVNVVQGDRPASGTKAPGNPAAGAKPASGEGSGPDGAGRTPGAGSGGSAGGPASAAVGPKGVVKAPAAGEEQANCGAPGQAKCRIDESGTPDGKDVWTKPSADLADARTAQKTAIDGAANIGSPNWSFTFSLPTGCTPFPVFLNVVLDVCKFQPVIHDLMSMIWAAASLFCITGMVGRAIREA